MVNVSGYSRLLAAVMEAMCHPTIKVTSIMPINCQPATEEILRRQSDIMDDNTNSVARMGEVHRFPILVSHMTSRVEVSGISTYCLFLYMYSCISLFLEVDNDFYWCIICLIFKTKEKYKCTSLILIYMYSP